jgi:hypothetical protein
MQQRSTPVLLGQAAHNALTRVEDCQRVPSDHAPWLDRLARFGFGCAIHAEFYENRNQLSELPARAGVGSIRIRRILPLLFAVAQSARHDPHHDGLFWDAVHRMATADSDPVSDGCSGGCRTFGLMDVEDTQLMPDQR